MIKNYHEVIHEYTNQILNGQFYGICDFEYNFVYLNSRKLRRKSGKFNKKRWLIQSETTVKDMRQYFYD